MSGNLPHLILKPSQSLHYAFWPVVPGMIPPQDGFKAIVFTIWGHLHTAR